jgi:hypothetical protein
MTNDEQIIPVRHSTLSGVGSTAAGTVGGAVKGSIKAAALWIVGFAVVGALLSVMITTGALPAILGMELAKVAAVEAGKVTLGSIVGSAAITGICAGVVGALTSGFPAVFGGLFGGVKGGAHAAERVSKEKGAATVLDAQVAAYQAQSGIGQTNVYTAPLATNDNKYNFPAQGSSMNMAGSSIQADSAQNLGLVDGQQLQRA